MEENKNLENKHHSGHKHHGDHQKDGGCCVFGSACHCGDRCYLVAKVLVIAFLGLALFSLGVNVGTRMISVYQNRMEFCACSHNNFDSSTGNLKNQNLRNLPTGGCGGQFQK